MVRDLRGLLASEEGEGRPTRVLSSIGAHWTRRRGDASAGVSLILAMIFMVMVAFIVVSLGAWTSTGLLSTISYNYAQQSAATANSATEIAVQTVRYNFNSTTINQWAPVACIPPSGQFTANGQTVSVWCRTKWSPTNVNSTRTVTFWTCPGTTFTQSCAQTPLLQAIVTYNDFPTSGLSSDCTPVSPTTTTSSTTSTTVVSTCGVGMQIKSWVFGVTTPTATAVSSAVANSACASNESFVVTGSGFSGGVKVNLISTTYPQSVAPSALVIAPPNLAGTQFTACVPLNSDGTVWTGSAYVVVTTSTGTSFDPPSVTGNPTTAGPVFTYP